MRSSRSFRPSSSAAQLIPVALASGVGLAILLIGRGFAFHADEWAFVIDRRDVTLDSLLVPWNEHLRPLPSAIYALLIHVFGVGSYVPFLVPIVVLHIGLVWGSYLLLRRPLGTAPASLAAIVLAVPGGGAEDLT